MKERLMVVLELEDGEAVVVRTKELMQFKDRIEDKLKEIEEEDTQLGIFTDLHLE